nr:hypothetical protein [Caldimonas sp.]
MPVMRGPHTSCGPVCERRPLASPDDTKMTRLPFHPIERAETTSLLSRCGTLDFASASAFINGTGTGKETSIDDVLATCAAIFLFCIDLIRSELRTRTEPRAALLAKSVEVLFLATLMTIAGFFMVYTIW